MKIKVKRLKNKNYRPDFLDFLDKYEGKELEVIAVRVKETHYLIDNTELDLIS